jgi:prepilin-type N-terminal cleavage/methylation domain-containing protein
MNYRARAFSLVELLVAVSIIAILVAMLFPSISAGYSLAQEKTCNANLSVLSKAIVAYCGNNKDQLPRNDEASYDPKKDLSNVGLAKADRLPGENSTRRWWCNKIYPLGIRTPNLYRCVSDPLHFNPSSPVTSSYGFNNTLTDPETSGGDGVTTVMQINDLGMTFLVGHCSPDSLGKSPPEPEIAEAMALDPLKWPIGHAANYDREAKERMGRGGFIMASGVIKVFTYSQVNLLKNPANSSQLKLFRKG